MSWLAFDLFLRVLGSINGPDSSDTRSSSSSISNRLLVVLSNCVGTRSARNGDGWNKFDSINADADADADDDANADADADDDAYADADDDANADADADADVNNDTGANTDADADDDADNDEDTANCANDACKFVSTVIGDTTSCCSGIFTDVAVKDNAAKVDVLASAAAASSILVFVHAFAFRPRCCEIADAVFLPLLEFII